MVAAARTSPEMIISGGLLWRERHLSAPNARYYVQEHQSGGGSSYAVAERELGRGGAVAHPDLGEDTRDVHLDRIGAEEKPLRDLPIAQPSGHEPQHLDLARGQSRGKGHAPTNSCATLRESGR